MCNQCVTPVHLGIKGFNIFILGSVHNGLGLSSSHPGSFMRAGTEDYRTAILSFSYHSVIS